MSLKLELKKFEVDSLNTGNKFWLTEIETADITEYLIEDTLRGDFRVEFTQPFDMGSSSLSFELIKNVESVGILSLEQSSQYKIGVQLWNNDVADFIGILDTSSSFFDETNQKYIVNFIDFLKWVYDTHEGYDALDVADGSAEITKEQWLGSYNSIVLASGTFPKASVNIGNNYAGIYIPSYNNNCKDMYANDFLKELIKHHSALMYMSGNGKIIFCDRTYGLANTTIKNITSDILNDGYNKPFAYYPPFNSVLLNVFGAWELNSMGSYQQWEGWALIYFENGAYTETLGINADLSNIPQIYKDSYIDLRQYLNHPPDYSFAYNQIFGSRTRQQTLDSYKQIINPLPGMKCTYKGTDLQLLERVRAGENNRLFMVYNMEKDYTKNTSNLDLIQTHYYD